MTPLSPRARSLFTPADPAADRDSRASAARACLAHRGCPPFPPFVEFLTTYAGGTFVFPDSPGLAPVAFPDLSHELLLTRFGDRQVCDPDWWTTCRPEMLPGGRDPDDWDLYLGGLGLGDKSGAMGPDGTIRAYFGAFAWSRPLAASLELCLENRAALAEGLARGYAGVWVMAADLAAGDGVARAFGLEPDPVASDRYCGCWTGPHLRVRGPAGRV